MFYVVNYILQRLNNCQQRFWAILAAVTVALISKIPVAHIHGGETTEGAFDEAFRHSITKMSHLHFTSTEQYRKRVIQQYE